MHALELLEDTDKVREWCEVLSAGLRVQQIERDGRPYLDRYFVAGWNPYTKQAGPAIFLHRFRDSDPLEQVHSHPWAFGIALILVGGYLETRCLPDGAVHVRTFKPGDVNVIGPADRHRVQLLEADCWTLFLAGHFVQPWQFYEACG